MPRRLQVTLLLASLTLAPAVDAGRSLDRPAGEVTVVLLEGQVARGRLPLEASVRYRTDRRLVVSLDPASLARLDRRGLSYQVLFEGVDPVVTAVLPVFRRAGEARQPSTVRGYDPRERVGFLLFPESDVPAGWVAASPTRSRGAGGSALVSERPPALGTVDARTAQAIREISDRIVADSLVAVVRRLSFDDTTATRRSRFAKKPESQRRVIDYLIGRFTRNLADAGDSAYVRIQGFTYQCPACRDTLPYAMENVIARVRGRTPGLGTIVIGAHLDATAHFTRYPGFPDSSWSWRREPAPGADDNASGVAAVLEAARVLAGLPFEFDVEFVAWDGEEILARGPFQLRSLESGGLLAVGGVGDGRWGSKAYLADALASGKKILAVINLDMIGYPTPGRGRGVDLLTNSFSWWLMEHFRSTRERVYPDVTLDVRTIFPAPTYSDHAPFWDATPPIPALALVEDWELPYPGYHTVGDTLGLLDPIQMRDVARVIAAALARFALPPTGAGTFDLSMTEADVRALRPGTGFSPFGNRIAVGEAIDIRVRARNVSKSYGSPSDVFDLVIEEERGSSFTELARWSIAGPFPFGTMWERRYPNWVAAPEDAGEKFFRVRILSGALPDADPSNNGVLGSVRVLGPGEAALNYHFAAPNPCYGSFEEIAFHYELTGDSDVEIRVFDLEGEKVATFYGSAAQAGGSLGANRVPGTLFRLEGRSPQSGVYLYQISLIRNQARVEKETGKFALIR